MDNRAHPYPQRVHNSSDSAVDRHRAGHHHRDAGASPRDLRVRGRSAPFRRLVRLAALRPRSRSQHPRTRAPPSGRGLAIASIVVVGVGWLVSLVVGLGSIGALTQSSEAGSGAATTSTPRSSATPSATVTPTPTPSTTAASTPPLPSVGQTVTSRSGVGFTVTGIQCGLGSQDDAFQTVVPNGQFCRVDFVVANGSSRPQGVSQANIFGYIENNRYEADYRLGNFGDDSYSTTVNPGLSIPCSVYFDVPPGASLDRVKLITGWWGGDGASVRLK